ncbi:hypothetical protein T265_11695 [Opisthorchis viverrini]|uniref:Uncharacterized protein n=1 Tax=Opisthorchis viverrini TaxID=6198 RepID=A0A074YY23_OPIVI|nr:hypothetical protein T265_11695 [Opisthorchis viverrini]KER19573.1 hypothetical protein T265_11695 [Opisthorchis viverrini]
MLRRIHIILVLLHAVTKGDCPPDYTQLSANLCTIQLNETNRFCEACTFCSNYGEQRNQLVFLHGRNVNLAKVNLQPNSRVWSEMHGLLGIPESESVVEWRDFDPRTPEFTSGPDIFKWGATRPDGNEPHLIYHKEDDAIYDVLPGPVILKLEVHCEYGGELLKDNLNVRFRADFPERFHNIVQPHPKFRGCPLTLKAATKIECARK